MTRSATETLVLTRVGTTRLYVEANAPAGSGFAAYWVVTEPAAPAASITPKVALDDPGYLGYFVFLLASPASPDALAAALAGAAIPPPAKTSFAWLAWDDANGKIQGLQFLQTGETSGRLTVANDISFSFGRYGFPLIAASRIEVVRDAAQEPLSFVVGYPDLAGANPPNRRGVVLPLYGASRFCLVNDQVLLHDFSAARETGWDASLYYAAFRKGTDVAFHYPFLDLPAGGAYHLLFHVVWDPLGARPPARTALTFTGAAYELTTTGGRNPVSKIVPVADGAVIPTALRTIYAERIGLRPRTRSETNNPARLVLDERPGPNRQREFYLAPAGEFELAPAPIAAQAEAEDDTRRLLCGLAGVEWIEYTQRGATAPGDIVTFVPYQPAYAPVFPLIGSGQPAAVLAHAGTLLDSTFTTSYVSVSTNPQNTGEEAFYSSQPATAPLFHQAEPAAKLLTLFDTLTAPLGGAPQPAAPMVWYSGVRAEAPLTASDYTQFETQILAPLRLTALAPAGVTARASRRAAAAGAVTTTTPQGFVTEVEGTVWKKVLLAQNRTSHGAVNELAFRSLGPQLREALQNNDLFLVATDPAPLGTFDKTITITDWPFTINVGRTDPATGFTNVLIFKFGREKKSLAERAAEYASWTAPTVFNGDPASVSTWILNYIADARQRATDNQYFRDFVNLMDDPAWNGVIALRVDIRTSSFPAEIRGLLGGIDLSQFFGHHIGINISAVETANGIRMSERSSLFGLISYVAKNTASTPDPLAVRSRALVAAQTQADERYAFRVLNLQVVFRNSEIIDFSSRVVLTATRWFGDVVTLPSPDPATRNSILIFGTYEDHNGIPFYTFQGTGAFRFVAASKTVNYVEFSKAQFVTFRESSSEEPGGPGAETVRSRFSLWGTINFLTLTGLDTLSFGSDDDAPDGATEGLAFSNMGVDMTFELEEGVQPVPTFEFDASLMGFDLSLSRPRPESLFSKFPFRVTKIESGGPNRKPADAGFLPVVTPKLQVNALQTEWYGLYFALNMGSMGALAQNAAFNAGIIAAWSPSPNLAGASVLIQIPGTGTGKKQLSLQSVLKLGINRIELVEQDGSPGYFLLNLTDIGLFFLGRKLPTAGSTNITLFADDTGASGSNLAWYAAYYNPNA